MGATCATLAVSVLPLLEMLQSEVAQADYLEWDACAHVCKWGCLLTARGAHGSCARVVGSWSRDIVVAGLPCWGLGHVLTRCCSGWAVRQTESGDVRGGCKLTGSFCDWNIS